VRARRQAAITRRLDELLADPALAEQQPRTAVQLDAVGPSWDDESEPTGRRPAIVVQADCSFEPTPAVMLGTMAH
jgi:hypothetical protein